MAEWSKAGDLRSPPGSGAQTFTIVATLIATIASAPQSYGKTAVTYTAPAITPAYGAASWGATSQASASNGSTSTVDSEIHAGTANNFGQQVTTSGAVGTNYANQAYTSNTIGGSQTQYSSSTNTPSYGSYDSYAPSSSGQSQTVGGSVTNFANSANLGSSQVGGFVTQAVNGNSYNNNQLSAGGSSTVTNAANAASAYSGSVWSKPATSYY